MLAMKRFKLLGTTRARKTFKPLQATEVFFSFSFIESGSSQPLRSFAFLSFPFLTFLTLFFFSLVYHSVGGLEPGARNDSLLFSPF